jgi:hypothetical protein
LPSSALEPSMSQNNLEAANKGLRFYSIYGEQDW